MKYLLVAALVLVVFWLWRHNRETERNDAATRAPIPPKPGTAVAEMVACEVCGLHLPKSEALIAGKGIYCSDAHRRQAGGL
jgi:uncharacterized protein